MDRAKWVIKGDIREIRKFTAILPTTQELWLHSLKKMEQKKTSCNQETAWKDKMASI